MTTNYPREFEVTLSIPPEATLGFPAYECKCSIYTRKNGSRFVEAAYVYLPGADRDTELECKLFDNDQVVLDISTRTDEIVGIELLSPPSPSYPEVHSYFKTVLMDEVYVQALNLGIICWSSTQILLDQAASSLGD